MTAPAIIAVVLVLIFALIWREVRNAPLGFEDRTGFHHGEPPQHAGDDLGEGAGHSNHNGCDNL